MADMVLFVGFGEPVRGREAKAVEMFGEAMAYYEKLKQQGDIESYEAVLLQPHGGELGGFILLRGQGERLMAAWQTEEFEQLTTKTRMIVDNFGVVPGLVGEALQRGMAQYQQQAMAMR